MTWKYMLMLLVSILVISCRDKAKLKVERYPNGNVMNETYYLDDSIKHGRHKGYYPNGNLKAEIDFVQNKRNGTAKYYDPDGKLKSEVTFVDDLLNGEAKWYHSNGQLEIQSFRVEGKEYGSAYFYNAQGKLETYQCIDFEDEVIYILKLDETGNVIREEGVVFSPNIKVRLEDPSELKVDKPIKFLITAAQPPGYSTQIWTRDFSNGNAMSRKLHPIENSTVTVERVYSDAGEQGLIVIGELRNQSGDLILRDSIIKVVHIKSTKSKTLGTVAGVLLSTRRG